MIDRRSALFATSLAFAFALGCGTTHDDASPRDNAKTLALTPVAWNASKADVGTVAAVVEQDKTVFVFGSKGVVTLVGGSVADTDSTIVAWRAAAEIPSADGLSTWLVGVDGTGRLQRISPDRAPTDVSDPYGLASDKVKSLSGATGLLAFLLESGVAVTDGRNVTHYAIPTPTQQSIATSKNLVAIADGTGVRVLAPSVDPNGKVDEIATALPGAAFVAFDDAGHLLAATPHAVYTVNAGQAALIYDAGARTIRQLVGGGTTLWLAIDSDLASYSGGQVTVGSGGTLAADATLAASPSGDVWIIEAGNLARFSGTVTVAPTSDEGIWNTTVQPIYASVCSNCHSPPGSGKSSSNIDLSTYDAWVARRATVYARVVTQAGSSTAMPPPSSNISLTDAQRGAIATWSKP